MKILFQLVLIAIIAAAGYFGRLYLIENAPVIPPKVVTPFVPTVEVVEVSALKRTLFVETEGVLASPSRLALTPEIAGRAVRVNAAMQEGGFLKAGTELVAIDEADFTLAAEAAAANTSASQASLELELANAAVAISDWEAMHQGTPPILVTRAPQIAAARAGIAGAKVAESQAQLNLSRAVLRMPFDGRIITRSVEFGERVDPSRPVVTIEKVDDLEVRLSILHRDLAFIELDLAGAGAKDLRMIVSANIGSKTYQWAASGKRTSPALDVRNPMITLIATIDDPGELGSGMPVSSLLPGLFVTAKIKGRSDVLVTPIPRLALQVDGSFFTVDENDKLRLQRPAFLQFTATEGLIAGALPSSGPLRVVTSVPTIALDGMDVTVGLEKPNTAEQL
jgi:RND family efflux transporter MFP subunit